MQLPIQLTFRGLEPSDNVSDYTKKKAEKLRTFHAHIGSCHVVIEAPTPHHRHGGAFRARIELAVPGHQLVAGAHNGSATGHSDLYAAIDDAFDDAERVLKRHAERQRESRRQAP
jgi:ribosomal subunit interface protein